jgi:polar amino acid transport system substrate-binding protein
MELYLAASLGTPPATLARLRHSYQVLLRDGSFARTFRGYQ